MPCSAMLVICCSSLLWTCDVSWGTICHVGMLMPTH